MDLLKFLFSQEDHRDTFNRFYPYHEEMQRLFGVPVYEERKQVGRYLNIISNLFENSVHESSESDSGISSPNLTDSIFNFSNGSPNSSRNTSESDSDTSKEILDCFLKSLLSPRMKSDAPTTTTFRDSWLKRSSTPNRKQTADTSLYSLFGNNALDLTSQIIKAKSRPLIHHHTHMREIEKTNVIFSVGMQSTANDIDQGVYPYADQGVYPYADQGVYPDADQGVYPDADQGVYPDADQGVNPDALMTFSRNPPLLGLDVMQGLYQRKPEPIPSFTNRAFPTVARLKNENLKTCKFCRKNGELPELYNGHETKDINGKVICPILRRYVCNLCGASGDKAHTRKYCPNYVGSEERLPMFRRLANGVISSSHNHK